MTLTLILSIIGASWAIILPLFKFIASKTKTEKDDEIVAFLESIPHLDPEAINLLKAVIKRK